MAARALVLAAALLLATALFPVAAANEDLPGKPWAKTCGYKSANECESFCILGAWVSKGGDQHTEVCVVPNCACYIGLVTLRHAVLGLRP